VRPGRGLQERLRGLLLRHLDQPTTNKLHNSACNVATIAIQFNISTIQKSNMQGMQWCIVIKQFYSICTRAASAWNTGLDWVQHWGCLAIGVARVSALSLMKCHIFNHFYAFYMKKTVAIGSEVRRVKAPKNAVSGVTMLVHNGSELSERGVRTLEMFWNISSSRKQYSLKQRACQATCALLLVIAPFQCGAVTIPCPVK